MKIALFGQAAFGKEVLERLLADGHQIVGVYAPPKGSRPDPLAEEAQTRGLPLLRYKRMRRKGRAIPELVEEHAALEAELNVLAYVTMILPPEVVDAPRHGSLCFHPSLLPRFRGGAAIPWQIILGERESGVTVFRPDEGVDTGPIVVQKGGVEIGPTATAVTAAISNNRHTTEGLVPTHGSNLTMPAATLTTVTYTSIRSELLITAPEYGISTAPAMSPAVGAADPKFLTFWKYWPIISVGWIAPCTAPDATFVHCPAVIGNVW